MSTFAYTASTAALDAVLIEEANHINDDVARLNLAKSPWIDLVKRGTFPAHQGYQIQQLIYQRSLPKYESTPGSGTFDTTGVRFSSVNSTALAADNTNITSGIIAGAHTDVRGVSYGAARIDIAQELKAYSLESTLIYSPYFDLRNFYFHTQFMQQVEATVQSFADAAHWVWENRFRTEYIKKCKNLVIAKASSTAIATTYVNTSGSTVTFENATITDLDADANTAAQTPAANISNALLDKISARRQRSGRSDNPWGMIDGVEVDALLLSPEAIQRLRSEPGYRDDYRHSDFANDLLKPFGVKQTHRGWALIADITIPRYNTTGSSSTITFVEVPAETFDSDGISAIPNSAYDSATYEIAVLLHRDVAEFLFPDPNIGSAGGISFDPQNYMGEFNWLNIKSQDVNPLGTVGRFAAQFASGTKRIKTEFGYVIFFDRTSGTYAA